MPTPAALEVVGLVKRYGDRTAVAGLDLTARHGRITAVLGPNGAGKTSTIECCEGLRTPDGGSVRVLGLPPEDRRLRPRVGVMLQDGGLPTSARADRVLDHVAAMYSRPRDVRELRDRLGIDAFARTTVRRLSGGQRQRLALATALVGDPELVFLDEPGAGLDPQARTAVWGLVRELRERGVAVVLTTHQMDEAQALADDVVVVDHGRVVARGSVGELLTAAHSATTRVRTREPAPLDAVRAALGPDLTVELEQDGAMTIIGDLRPDDVHRLTGALAEAGVLVADLTVGVRTLEDVFLELTGTDLR